MRDAAFGHGSRILRLDRAEDATSGSTPTTYNLLMRGRRSVAIDLKRREGTELALKLIEQADALIEGFRPGVMERLGLGPEVCQARNPKLVYGRMTGWGQDGPLALAAGHDINYIALTGALHSIGRRGEPPVPPLNLVGDFGGGGVYLALGVVAGMLEAQKSGKGQVVDAAMIDGASSLMAGIYGLRGAGVWNDNRGENILDTGAHYYDVYETSDGKYVSIGSIEGKFYAELLRLTGLEGEKLPRQNDRTQWPAFQERLKAVFKTKTRDQWCTIMEGSEVCFAPVLTIDEAPQHPHNAIAGPSSRSTAWCSRRRRRALAAPCRRGAEPARGASGAQHSDAALAEWGIAPAEIAALEAAGTLG